MRSEINRTPECGWMGYSCCREVEIEGIGTFHMKVSLQAEQVTVVTGQRAMWKDC